MRRSTTLAVAVMLLACCGLPRPSGAQAPPSVREQGAAAPVAASIAVGAGFGTRQAETPTDAGVRRLSLSTFPAIDILLTVLGVSESGLTPGVQLAYRTSVGYTLRETPLHGVEQSSPARTHELLVDAIANIHFGHGRADPSLPLSLGYAFRNLRTDVELSAQPHTLSGPHARVALRIPLAAGDVVATLGPDVTWIVQVSEGLQAAGLSGSGFAIGGEAQLAVRLSERIALRALYREAHTFVTSAETPRSFRDVQRFVTAGVAATY